jgi:hypothetical protein
MNTNAQEQKEKLIGFELMRLMQLTRDESVGNLLDAALAGREKNVASVSKLYGFVLRSFGDTTGNTPSTVTSKFWNVCSAYFTEAGLTEKEQLQIKNRVVKKLVAARIRLNKPDSSF